MFFVSTPSDPTYRSPCLLPLPNRASRLTISAAMPRPSAFSTNTSPSPVSANGPISSSATTAATVNRFRRTANPTTTPTTRATRFQTCISAPPVAPGPAPHPKRENFLCLCCPDMCTAPLDGCHRTRTRGKAPTATGESRDGVWGKRAQLCLGPRGDASEPRREMRIDQVPNARRKSWGEGDESCQCRGYRPGELRRWGSDRNATLSRTGVCEGTVRGTNRAVKQWLGRRHEEPDGAESTPTSVSLLSRRVQESSARSIDRITQREGAYPCWADRSESSARSYAVVPGSGTDPPGF